MLKILIILVLIIIIILLSTKINKNNKNNEDFVSSTQLIQNLTNLYNDTILKSNNLEITQDASFNNLNINGELRIKSRFVLNIDNSGNLEGYDISNNVKNTKLWNSSDFLKSGAKNVKLLEPALCDASGRYCIYTRRYDNQNIYLGDANNNPYGLNPDGHMEFIVYDTDKKGNGSFDEKDNDPKNLYLTQGFVDGYKSNIAKSNIDSNNEFNKNDLNTKYKNLHTSWKTVDGDTIPFLFSDNAFTTAQAWDSVRYGKQSYNFVKNPKQVNYSRIGFAYLVTPNNPYTKTSTDTSLRADLT